jgi:hypothetical protein
VLFDPGAPEIPYGMLDWRTEGEPALVGDPDSARFVSTPISDLTKSCIARDANLKLGEDGTLEGDVRIELTGHCAIVARQDHRGDSAAERAKDVIESIRLRIATADVTEVRFDDGPGSASPLVTTYHVRVPDYVQPTEKRLLLRPAFFQYGEGPWFESTRRTHPVSFLYPWRETDDVHITLPGVCSLDETEPSTSIEVPNVGAYTRGITTSADGRTIEYVRSFDFGRHGTLVFSRSAYPDLKQVFDRVHNRDDEIVSLRRADAAAH